MKPFHTRRFDVFVLLFAALSAGCLVRAVGMWQGWVGGEPLFRPVQSVFLSAGLTTMFSSRAVLDCSPRAAKVLVVATTATLILFAASIMADR